MRLDYSKARRPRPTRKLPLAWEMNEMAERVLKTEEKADAPMVWKTAFAHGYEDGFRKTHPAR